VPQLILTAPHLGQTKSSLFSIINSPQNTHPVLTASYEALIS